MKAARVYTSNLFIELHMIKGTDVDASFAVFTLRSPYEAKVDFLFSCLKDTLIQLTVNLIKGSGLFKKCISYIDNLIFLGYPYN